MKKRIYLRNIKRFTNIFFKTGLRLKPCRNDGSVDRLIDMIGDLAK